MTGGCLCFSGREGWREFGWMFHWTNKRFHMLKIWLKKETPTKRTAHCIWHLYYWRRQRQREGKNINYGAQQGLLLKVSGASVITGDIPALWCWETDRPLCCWKGKPRSLEIQTCSFYQTLEPLPGRSVCSENEVSGCFHCGFSPRMGCLEALKGEGETETEPI